MSVCWAKSTLHKAPAAKRGRGDRGRESRGEADSSGGGGGGGSEGETRDQMEWGDVRGFRTANYVNCRCCKLPSQFAFILHTIHTVSAHLARNPSTWILLLPPARRRGRRRGKMAADRARWMISPRTEGPLFSFEVPPSYLSFIIAGTRRCADTSIRQQIYTDVGQLAASDRERFHLGCRIIADWRTQAV